MTVDVDGVQVLYYCGKVEATYVFCFFFFFQAEDGIRDYKVTGVQTCALPICGGHAAQGHPPQHGGEARSGAAPSLRALGGEEHPAAAPDRRWGSRAGARGRHAPACIRLELRRPALRARADGW